jgi:hypothetical protein
MVVELAQQADPAQLARLFDVLHGAVWDVGRAAQPRLALEMALLKAVQLAPTASIPELLGRVEQLLGPAAAKGGPSAPPSRGAPVVAPAARSARTVAAEPAPPGSTPGPRTTSGAPSPAPVRAATPASAPATTGGSPRAAAPTPPRRPPPQARRGVPRVPPLPSRRGRPLPRPRRRPAPFAPLRSPKSAVDPAPRSPSIPRPVDAPRGSACPRSLLRGRAATTAPVPSSTAGARRWTPLPRSPPGTPPR